jgi:hypothetical protein
MTIKELRATVRTYKDFELTNIQGIIDQEELTKQRIISKEINRRAAARESGKYVDETLDPKIPIRKRLS